MLYNCNEWLKVGLVVAWYEKKLFTKLQHRHKFVSLELRYHKLCWSKKVFVFIRTFWEMFSCMIWSNVPVLVVTKELHWLLPSADFKSFKYGLIWTGIVPSPSLMNRLSLPAKEHRSDCHERWSLVSQVLRSYLWIMDSLLLKATPWSDQQHLSKWLLSVRVRSCFS